MEDNAVEERVEDAYNAILADMQPAAPPESIVPIPVSAPVESTAAYPALPPTISEEAYNEHYETALLDLQRRQKAVRLITRAWQRFSDVRIYRYYRDLIKFRERGDPGLMLKCINPAEASLVDAAAGVHVRFRLGGDQFPPAIFYKIFIHNPLVDICAFAPRDYTMHKQKGAKEMNNKGPSNGKNPHSGWYERIENNGWRPVADRTLAMFDQITQDTSCRVIPFHHDKNKRRRNKQQWAKMRKREWLQKMYAEGKAAEVSGGAPAAEEQVPPDSFMPQDPQEKDWRPDDLEFEEDEAAVLVEWSDGLDFEKYVEGWSDLATSARSELFCGAADFPLESLEQMYI